MATAGSGRKTRSNPRFWSEDSSPFSATGPEPQPCSIVLRQIDDNDFLLVDDLVLTPPTTDGGGPTSPLVIPGGSLISDLASVPEVLGWFARRHGRHTPAALVHDHLITGRHEAPPPDLPPDWALSPVQADLVLRETLLASGVPPVRSYLMWSAAAARTRWKAGGARRWSLVAWGIAAAVGTAALAAGALAGAWTVVLAALVAPLPASVLWGRQIVAGLVAGYAVWWALIGSAPAWLAYKLYQAVEGVVWLVRRLTRRRDGAVTDAPPPVPYDER